MNGVQVGKLLVGPGQPCFLAAEVGINHNGDVKLAHQMIEAAAAVGASAVKFQNYRTEDFLSDCALTHEYVSLGKTVVEKQYDMFKRYELPGAAFWELKAHCERLGVVFFSTPTGSEGVKELEKMGVPLLKNGSDYLVHLPLIREMARTGIPTILSTGMATLAEIDDAVRAFREAGGKELVLLHCTSSYPTPMEDVHLRKLPSLAAAFDCLVGLSDHTSGIVAAVGAVALGAVLVEKHFTLDKNLPGPDHRFSADPAEFRTLVDAVRNLEKNLGQSAIGPAASESLGRENFRLSCAAVSAFPAGYILTESDIIFRRPGTGWLPKDIDLLIGRKLARAVSAGQILGPQDL